MSNDPHARHVPGHADAVAHHTTDDHGDDHGHDDHAHGDEPLGPIDVRAWGAAILGVGFGVVVALCFVVTTGALGYDGAGPACSPVVVFSSLITRRGRSFRRPPWSRVGPSIGTHRTCGDTRTLTAGQSR